MHHLGLTLEFRAGNQQQQQQQLLELRQRGSNREGQPLVYEIPHLQSPELEIVLRSSAGAYTLTLVDILKQWIDQHRAVEELLPIGVEDDRVPAFVRTDTTDGARCQTAAQSPLPENGKVIDLLDSDLRRLVGHSSPVQSPIFMSAASLWQNSPVKAVFEPNVLGAVPSAGTSSKQWTSSLASKSDDSDSASYSSSSEQDTGEEDHDSKGDIRCWPEDEIARCVQAIDDWPDDPPPQYADAESDIAPQSGSVETHDSILSVCHRRIHCTNPRCPRVHGIVCPIQEAHFSMNVLHISQPLCGITVCALQFMGVCPREPRNCRWRHFEAVRELTPLQQALIREREGKLHCNRKPCLSPAIIGDPFGRRAMSAPLHHAVLKPSIVAPWAGYNPLASVEQKAKNLADDAVSHPAKRQRPRLPSIGATVFAAATTATTTNLHTDLVNSQISAIFDVMRLNHRTYAYQSEIETRLGIRGAEEIQKFAGQTGALFDFIPRHRGLQLTIHAIHFLDANNPSLLKEILKKG